MYLLLWLGYLVSVGQHGESHAAVGFHRVSASKLRTSCGFRAEHNGDRVALR